jgi:hypothetical protein
MRSSSPTARAARWARISRIPPAAVTPNPGSSLTLFLLFLGLLFLGAAGAVTVFAAQFGEFGLLEQLVVLFCLLAGFALLWSARRSDRHRARERRRERQYRRFAQLRSQEKTAQRYEPEPAHEPGKKTGP